MSSKVLISICIPAYKRTEFLKRLLDSICIQVFRDFEVVVTDDSPDQTIELLCIKYQTELSIRYFRNEKPLGSPENWNEAIRRSEGQWIKVMHDDDWLADEHSLGQFASVVFNNPQALFIFSAYRNVFLEEERSKEVFLRRSRYKAFLKNKATLFSSNIIGPPSVVLYKKEGNYLFDKTLIWVVDIDFYIRYLVGKKPIYINKILVNVGLSNQQVTQDCFRLRPIEIPENFYLLDRVGTSNLKNILIYDAWWRLMRNLEIRSQDDISGSGYKGKIPTVILSMIAWQKLIPLKILRIGVFSRSYMFLHFLTHYNRISK